MKCHFKIAAAFLCATMLLLSPLWARPESGSGAWYEIFVSSFYDSNGDGIGDINGITEKLDYLNDGNSLSGHDLTVDGLWLMPIMPSPSYHKYDVTDYCAIDPSYGTLHDFDKLIAACHKRGVQIILDLVLNHTSKDHPWFQAAAKSLNSGSSAYTDYYHFTKEKRDGWHPVPNAEGWYYEGAFGEHMPDLNLDSQSVRREIEAIVSFWTARGLDGFRLDAVTKFYGDNSARNTAFLGWLIQVVKTFNPEAYLVGEAWTDQGTIISLYESGIVSLFNFPFSGPSGIFASSIRNQDGKGFAQKAADWQKKLRNVSPEAMDAVFLTNHDMARSAGMLMNDLKKHKLAAAMYLLLPGNPFIYYGEELGMQGSGKDENKRMPFIWSVDNPAGICAPPPNADPVRMILAGADAQNEDPDSLLSFYRNLLRLRSQYPAIAMGVLSAMDIGEKAVSVLRFDWEGDAIYVVHNLSKESVDLCWDYGGSILSALNSKEDAPVLSQSTLHIPGYATVLLR